MGRENHGLPTWQSWNVELNRFIDTLEKDLNRIHSIQSDLSSPVPTCPGWDVGRLIGHLGRVHRMALAVLTTGSMEPAAPDQLESPPVEHEALRAYFSSSADLLVATLRDIDPQTPCWTFLGEPHVASFWFRRMAHEHSVHRFDAELAIGDPRPIPADTAIDGIDEYFMIHNVRTLPKRPEFTLSGSVHLHSTDNGLPGEWMIEHVGSRLVVTQEHGKGDAAVRGPASDLYLGLWGRLDLKAGPQFERFGSSEVIESLASLGGT